MGTHMLQLELYSPNRFAELLRPMHMAFYGTRGSANTIKLRSCWGYSGPYPNAFKDTRADYPVTKDPGTKVSTIQGLLGIADSHLNQ